MYKTLLFASLTSILCLGSFIANAQFCIAGPDGPTTPDGGPCVNTVVTAVPFLRINPDARGGAMGDAG